MRERWLVVVVVLGSLLVAACADDDGDEDESGAGGPVPVVVDTDLALDDLVALLFLLSSPDADVRAVTVSGTGEVRCPQGLDVIRGLLAVTGDGGVPVACGRSTPLEGDHAFPDEWRDASDAAYGLDLPDPAAPAPDGSATDLLVEFLGDGEVTLLTLGPLTNVAEAFREEPDLAAEVASIVVMGGAVDVPGNVHGEGVPPSTAEWNLYVDPSAAAEVVSSGAEILLVPLDATNLAPVTLDFVDVVEANAHTDAASLVAELLVQNPMIEAGEAYFWDPLAAAAVVDRTLLATEEVTVTVVTSEGRDSGRTLRTSDGDEVTVAVGADTAAFEALLVRTLDNLGADEALLEPPEPVGEAVVRFDGTTCSYEGPAAVPAGRMLFTYESTVTGSGAAVVDLSGELTIEEIIEYVLTHPEAEGEPPGVEALTFVDPDGETRVEVTPPTMAVACSSEGGVPVAGGSFSVD